MSALSLCGSNCERKLVEELRMHLAWCWFTGLGFDQEIPQHLWKVGLVQGKNGHGGFPESKLLEEWFEQIVRQCAIVAAPGDGNRILRTWAP